MFTTAFYVKSWLYYDVLSICICVGGIKLFRFKNMKQAFQLMGAVVVFITISTVVIHFILDRSYNNYTADCTSPLLLQVPDLIEELYKKCSWLPVIDVILPGVLLSYLRMYDSNYNTGYGGVYTVVGNLSFILSTIVWISL
jgi:hypothetical protein